MPMADASQLEPHLRLLAGLEKTPGVGRGVVPLQLPPRILQILLVAVHAHA